MEKNVFINRRRKYKFTGLFESDKTEKELDEMLHNLGFRVFKYVEVDRPTDYLKKGNMGRPLRYSEDIMKSVVNREKSDKDFSLEFKKPENSIRNMRSRWTRKYPNLLKKKDIKEKGEM